MSDSDEIITTTDIKQGWDGGSLTDNSREYGNATEQGLRPEQQQGAEHN